MYLGQTIRRVQGGFSVRCNPSLIGDMLSNMPASTPGVKAEARVHDEEPLPADEAKQHRGNVGELMFIAHERCDVQYAAQEIARSTANPTVGDVLRIRRAARYHAGTKDFENLLMPDILKKWEIVALVDSDWATDEVGRRSTPRGNILVNVACVVAYSRMQATPALSSAEA